VPAAAALDEAHRRALADIGDKETGDASDNEDEQDKEKGDAGIDDGQGHEEADGGMKRGHGKKTKMDERRGSRAP
jgi:hypothetical protein